MPFRSSPPFAGRTRPRAVVAALESSPYAYAVRWDNGFYGKYSDPTTSGISQGQDASFSPDGGRILIGGTGTLLNTWLWDSANGFGVRTTTSVTNVSSLDFNAAGDELLVSLGGAGNTIAGFPYSSGGGVGTKRTNTAGVLENNSGAVFLPGGSKIATSGFYPFPALRLFNYSSGTGSEIAHSQVVNSLGLCVTVGPLLSDGAYPVVYGFGYDPGPFENLGGFDVYKWNGSTLVSRYDGVASLVRVRDSVFDKRGNLIVASDGSPYLSIYPFSASGLGTRKTNPSGVVNNSAIHSLHYDETDDVLFVGQTSSPYLVAYQLGESGVVRRFPDPPTLPTSRVNGLSFI